MVQGGSIVGTLAGMDPATLAESLRRQQEEELAARTLAATQSAQSAGQEYQTAAQAPQPELNIFEQLIPALFGNVASVLSQNPVFGERGQEQVQQSRATLLQARAQNLSMLREVWNKKADAAQQAGDFEAEAKARTKLESLHNTYDTVKQNADRAFTAEQNRLNREAQITQARISASRPAGGAFAQFDAGSVAQGIVEGTVAPDPTGFSRGQWGAIVGQVRKIDPKFNTMKAGLDYHGVRQFVRTLNQGQQVQLRQRAQNAMVTADFINELVGEIQRNAPPRTPVTVANRMQLNAIKNGAWGPGAADAATKLEGQIAAWRLEMAAVYSGGYAPQEAHLKEASHLIDPNWSLNRIQAGLLIGRRDTNIRLNAVNEVGAMGPSNPLVPGAPPSGAVNIGPNPMPFGVAGQPTTVLMLTKNGKQYHVAPDKVAEAEAAGLKRK
jgi:hypothetical protein